MGTYGLSDLFGSLSIKEDADGADYATVGGWALDNFGHIPKPGEEFEFSGYLFSVLEMDGHRLRRLGITRLHADTPAEASGEEM